jgi:hypothetical protein
VYVVPRDGSPISAPAIARCRSDHDCRPRLCSVVEVRAADESGRPIPDVRFLLRLDGELILPCAAADRQAAGYATVTGSDGALTDHLPIWFFELWPLRTEGELRDILASISESAPVQVAVKPGRNTATLTFTRRR